jgi:hypothetical protein
LHLKPPLSSKLAENVTIEAPVIAVQSVSVPWRSIVSGLIECYVRYVMYFKIISRLKISIPTHLLLAALIVHILIHESVIYILEAVDRWWNMLWQIVSWTGDSL